jgi:hypothetical protein
VLQLGQLDLIVIAEPVGQCDAFVPDFAGGEFLRVDCFFQLVDFRADLLGLAGPLGPLAAKLVAVLDQSGRLGDEGFLVEVEFGDFGLGLEDVPLRLPEAAEPLSELLAVFGHRPLAFLPALLELSPPAAKVLEPFLALGQLDLNLGRIAVVYLPLGFEAFYLAAEFGQAGFHFGQGGLRLVSSGLDFRQGPRGRLVLCRRRLEFRLPHAALPVELNPPLFGRGDCVAVSGEYVEGLPVFGRASLDPLPLLGDLLFRLFQGGLGPADVGFQRVQL